MPAASPPFIRFHQLVDRCEDGCWRWLGSTMNSGYGQFKAFGKMVAAHRYSFELYKGPIPAEAMILHSCDNKWCVNPDHLRPGTGLENMREASERGRLRSGVTHPQFGKSNPRPNQAHRVRVLGRDYESQKSAERELGLGSGTVRYWILNMPEKAQIISKGAI